MRQHKPTLTVFCGLPGAGKTNIAKQVERQTGAVRLCTDEWMADLKLDFFDEAQRNLLQDRLIVHGLNLVKHRVDVILEDGQWSRVEREEKVDAARKLKARISIHVFNLSVDELWRRLQHRNDNLTHGTVLITKALLESYLKLFQVPQKEELQEYDEVYLYDDNTPLKHT